MRRLRAIDIFSGMGSASLGLQAAGIEIAAALDADSHAATNYERNVGLQPIVQDIRKVSGEELRQNAGVHKGEIDIVVGCPPCQNFSTLRATRHSEPATDPRSSLLWTFSDRVAELLPRAVVFENVPGLLRPNFRNSFFSFLGRLSRLGYVSAFGLLECADFGIPQFRKRVISVAIRKGSVDTDGQDFLPKATHARPSLARGLALRPWRTVRQTIGRLPSLCSGEKASSVSNHDVPDYDPNTMRMIRNIPRNGGSRRSLPRHLWLPCHKRLEKTGAGGAASPYGRMWWDRPAPTVTTRCTNPSSGRFLHPEQDRAITAREAMRLQTIPDNVVLVGPRTLLARQIGNAVPHQLMKILGTKVESVLAA